MRGKYFLLYDFVKLSNIMHSSCFSFFIALSISLTLGSPIEVALIAKF